MTVQLRAYQAILPEICVLSATLVAVSPQLPDSSLSTAEKNALEFEVLSDVGNWIARQFRLVFRLDGEILRIQRDVWSVDLAAYNGEETWELPIPATYVVRKEAVLELAFVDHDYRRRLEPMRRLTEPATRRKPLPNARCETTVPQGRGVGPVVLSKVMQDRAFSRHRFLLRWRGKIGRAHV